MHLGLAQSNPVYRLPITHYPFCIRQDNSFWPSYLRPTGVRFLCASQAQISPEIWPDLAGQCLKGSPIEVGAAAVLLGLSATESQLT